MDLKDIYKPIRFVSEISVSLKYFIDEIEQNETNLSPAYQRGSVWTTEQRELFMGHLLSGGEVLPIVFQRVPDQGNAEVIDGKQRCETIMMWLRDEVGARLLGSDALIFRRDVTSGLTRVDVRFRYINLPWEERKRFYVKLNSAGTPHTVEQLEAALRAERPR